MKHILNGIVLIALISCEKQETPVQNELDTLNLKKAEQREFINIEVDSNFTDTIIIKISD